MPVDGSKRHPVGVRRCEGRLLLGLLLAVVLPPVHAALQGLLPISTGLHVRPLRRRRLENLRVRVHQAGLFDSSVGFFLVVVVEAVVVVKVVPGFDVVVVWGAGAADGEKSRSVAAAKVG